jgi:hypothetical protein
MEIDLDHKKFYIDGGWGLEPTGMKGTLFGDGLTIQGYAHDYKHVEKIADKITAKKNVSEKVRKEMSEIDKKLDGLFVDDELDLHELIKQKKKKTETFTLPSKGRWFTPHYFLVEKVIYAYDKNGRKIPSIPERLKIKYYFIADVITHLHLPIAEKDPFNNKNEKFKKEILNHLDPRKTEWKYLLDLEIPMKSLMVCDKSYYRDRWKSKEAARELASFVTSKKMKVYAIITDRKSLLKIYNSQSTENKLIDENDHVFKYANEDLPNDKVYHGIMLY